MLTPTDLATGGVEIPAVDKEDLKRLWAFFEAQGERAGATVSYDRSMVEKCVQAGADLLAVFARMTILTYLKSTSAEIREAVFEEAARYPLPMGMQSFDPEAFLTSLDT